MARPTILVVDDDPDVLLTLSEALSGEGYRVLISPDYGHEIRRVAAREPIALILLDLALPTMDGVTISKALRHHPLTAPIPIIAMSGRLNLAHAAAHMMVDDCLSKPFGMHDLFQKVAHWRMAQERVDLMRVE